MPPINNNVLVFFILKFKNLFVCNKKSDYLTKNKNRRSPDEAGEPVVPFKRFDAEHLAAEINDEELSD